VPYNYFVPFLRNYFAPYNRQHIKSLFEKTKFHLSTKYLAEISIGTKFEYFNIYLINILKFKPINFQFSLFRNTIFPQQLRTPIEQKL